MTNYYDDERQYHYEVCDDCGDERPLDDGMFAYADPNGDEKHRCMDCWVKLYPHPYEDSDGPQVTVTLPAVVWSQVIAVLHEYHTSISDSFLPNIWWATEDICDALESEQKLADSGLEAVDKVWQQMIADIAPEWGAE